jgi:predicted ATP-grasp superfamily ATP-dependent carboligase
MAIRDKPAAIRPAAGVSPGVSEAYDVLVLDANCKQSLASVRSLGRAGLRVAAGEYIAECEPEIPVLAFHSRYCSRNVVLPTIVGDGAEFGAAVVEFVAKYPTRVLLPAGDAAISALLPVREKLAGLGCVLALAPDPVLEITNDKDRTLAVARRLGIDYPKTMKIASEDDVPAMLDEFRFPIVIKPTSSWTGQSISRLQPVEVIDESEAVGAIRRFFGAGAGVLAQEWVGGRREGVSLFVAGGDVLASCAHVAHRTHPALGGVSVMRESIPLPDDIYPSAVRLVKTIGLEGVCEVEFRRDADNRPMLMEINARLAGTIENAVHSGVDFPLMIWQWATGLPVDRVPGYRTGVRTRWLQGDMRWLIDNQRRIGRPDSVSRARALWTFATEFVRTRHYDCMDRRDLGPSFAELRIMAAAARRSRNTCLPAEHPHRKGASDARS